MGSKLELEERGRSCGEVTVLEAPSSPRTVSRCGLPVPWRVVSSDYSPTGEWPCLRSEISSVYSLRALRSYKLVQVGSYKSGCSAE